MGPKFHCIALYAYCKTVTCGVLLFWNYFTDVMNSGVTVSRVPYGTADKLI